MRKTKIFGLVLIVLMLLLVTIAPVQAIIGGEPDNGQHPYVGIMFSFGMGEPVACTGTLISPTIFLTAGHCTALTNGDDVYVWFNESLPFMPLIDYFVHPWDFPGYEPVMGTAYTYPEFTWDTYVMSDVGVVVLTEPVVGVSEFGALPAAGELSGLKTERGLQNTTFTTVGYGYQAVLPGWQNVWEPKRLVAHPKLIQIDVPGTVGDFAFLFTCNPVTGGIGFIDSGSPNFLGESNVIAGVTSSGNQGSMGWGLAFRLDQPEVLDWIGSFLP